MLIAALSVEPDAGATPPATTISSFDSVPSVLPNVGGIVVLTANVSGATTCSFATKKPVSGLPATLPCTSGTATTTATFPPNPSKTVKKYTVTLTAMGSKSVKAKAIVQVGTSPPVPTVTGITPSSGSILGGEIITVHGTDLSTASSVTFGGLGGGAVVSVQSDDEITVTDPSQTSTGTVDFVVALFDGAGSAIVPADQFTYVDGPGGFPTSISGTVSGVSTINPELDLPETSWSGSFTMQFDPNCAAAQLQPGANAACYSATSFTGSGLHGWYTFPQPGQKVCDVPFTFSASTGLGAWIQADSSGVYHLYYYLEDLPDTPPSCTTSQLTVSSDVLVGDEHLTTGGDTVAPDVFQIGQTSASNSGQDAGGDGLSGNGVDGPGWTASMELSFSY